MLSNLARRCWEVVGILVVIALVSVVLFLFVMVATGEKSVKQYYLAGLSGDLRIKADIEWSTDETTIIPRHITLPEVVSLIDSLNSGLRKYPRLK